MSILLHTGPGFWGPANKAYTWQGLLLVFGCDSPGGYPPNHYIKPKWPLFRKWGCWSVEG